MQTLHLWALNARMAANRSISCAVGAKCPSKILSSSEFILATASRTAEIYSTASSIDIGSPFIRILSRISSWIGIEKHPLEMLASLRIEVVIWAHIVFPLLPARRTYFMCLWGFPSALERAFILSATALFFGVRFGAFFTYFTAL